MSPTEPPCPLQQLIIPKPRIVMLWGLFQFPHGGEIFLIKQKPDLKLSLHKKGGGRR